MVDYMEKVKTPIIRHYAVVLILLCTLLASMYLIVSREISVLEKTLAGQVERRSNALREYFLIGKHMLFSLQRSMQENLLLSESGILQYPATNWLQDYPQFQAYGIESQLVSDSETAIARGRDVVLTGSLSGVGSIKNLDESLRIEINAALALNAVLDSVINAIPDLKWAYYTSAEQFIYLSPAVSLAQFHFDSSQLQKAFWVQAIPENNPSFGMVVTDVYNDGAGKGMMISLSIPVRYQGVFRGVVSMDIGMDSLAELVAKAPILGSSALIDERHQVIIKERSLRSTLVEHIPGDMIFLQPVLDEQVMLLHKVSRSQIVLAAVRQSGARLAIAAFALVLIFMLYQQRQLVKKIKRLADTDPLTRLMNRRAMTRVVQAMISYNSRYEQHIGFLILDIDHFKRVNDSHGHGVGDSVLVEMARILLENVRESDQVSRHGGEEFLVALPNTDITKAFQLAERMRRAVNSHTFTDHGLRISLSIGCAELKKDEDYSDVLNRADLALYQAKKEGRNRTIISS